MKNRTLNCILIGLLLTVAVTVAKAQTVDAWVEKYSISFDNDGTGKMLAAAQFGEVPAKDQAEVLARILDKLTSQKPINSNAITGACRAILMIKVPWTDHLKKSIYSLTTSSDYIARSCGLHLLAIKQKDTAKETILAFQNDPDDRTRASFMDEIKEWPDAEPIYQKYIQAHESDPNYAESVQSAKDCLAIHRQMQKSSGQ
jgi:hypothetical protein